MIRYKLVRIVGGRYLSANQAEDEPRGISCLEYRVGEITKVLGLGVACYKRKKDALKPGHIRETQKAFNGGRPIALLRLRPIGSRVFTDCRYKRGKVYEGGINYRSVEVLKATQID